MIEITFSGEYMKSLVVFYSFTGKTRLVARIIAEELKADLIEIEEVKQRKNGTTAYITGGYGAITNKASKIKPVGIDFKQYDTIFIGSPVWASRPVPAVNAFLRASNFVGRSVVPFFTMGGNSAGKALANIIPKIERRRGKVIDSFAIKSYRVTEDEMTAKSKEAIMSFIS
jgi:flavodoxin